MLDFPLNPSTGDTYTGVNNVVYYYDGQKWISAGSLGTIGGTNPGPVPPSNPANGTLWFNTNEGRLYTWFDDGDSTQWVDTTGT